MADALIQGAGWAILALVLVDLYATVLYPRGGWALVSQRLSRTVWGAFRAVARLPGGDRARFLTFAGPTLAAAVLANWFLLLMIAFALIVWPALGAEVQKTTPPTPSDFWTAVYYSGYTVSTVGYGDIVPQTAFYRVLAVVEGLLGFAVLTLGLSYLISVYSALVGRNSLGLALHHGSGGTNDAAALLAGLGPGGDFSGARQAIADFARAVHDVHESHHSYPLLHYFRARNPVFSITNIAGMTADLASLATTAMDEDRYHGVVRSAAVTGLRGGSVHILTDLAPVFLPRAYRPDGSSGPSAEDREQWRRRFHDAADVLAAAGIAVTPDRDAAAERYADLRAEWGPQVAAFGRYMLEPAADDGAASRS